MSVTVYRGDNFVLTNEYVLHKAVKQPLLEPVLVLVPDRFTLQAEKILLQQQPHLLNTRVVTFTMLYRLVADELNFRHEPVKVLDKTSSVLNLWTAIRQVQDELTWFKNSVGHYDFAEKMFNTINQMRSSCVDFASLEDKAISAVAKKKYHDINLIYQAYSKLIAPCTDSSGMLEYLMSHIQDCSVVKNATVFVCGFPSLSPARLAVLNSICSTAKQVTIAASESELRTQVAHYPQYDIEIDSPKPTVVTVRNETERGEATIIIERIVSLLSSGVKPENIVVLLTEFDTHASVWQAVADKYHLPVNLDVGTKLSTTAEAKYLRDLLELLVNDDTENTVAVLFNRESGIDEETIFALENKIIKSNLRARMIPEIKKLSAVKDNITLCNELKSLTSNEKLQNILDQIATNCQSQNLNLREFITLFWTLCCSIKISNIPQFVDRVLIAPVNDWVPSRVDYLFIANCTTENFPKGQSDADILQEADLVGTQITPTPKIQRERNYRRAELLKSVAGCQLTLSGTHDDFEMVDYQPFNRFALPSLDSYCSPIKVGRDLFFLENKVSTTSLEKYYQCPHFCFLQNGLKMTPRPLYHLEANTVGSAIHRALQEYVTLNQELKKQHKNTAENQVKIVNLAIEKGMQKLEYDYEPLTKNIEKEIRFIIQELAKIFATSKFQESMVETRVERKLEHDLTLVGKVDRVDYALLDNNERAFLVLDYKTGTVLDSVPTSIFIGNKLQLPIYSSILSDEFNHLTGAGYLPLSSGYATEKKEFNLKGFVNQSYADLLPVGLVKTKNSFVDDDTIAGIFYHANKMVNQAVERILEGDVAPQPVEKGACKYCPINLLCPQAETNFRLVEMKKATGKSSFSFKDFKEIKHE